MTALYQEIRAAAFHNATIVALGYPLIVSGLECPDLEIGPLGIKEDEQVFIRRWADHLNETLEDAARVAGIHFVRVANPAIPTAPFSFFGHEVCATNDPWILGITAPEKHRFHPNADGQALYANAVNAFLDQKGVGYGPGFFASGLPKNPAPQP